MERSEFQPLPRGMDSGVFYGHFCSINKTLIRHPCVRNAVVVFGTAEITSHSSVLMSRWFCYLPLVDAPCISWQQYFSRATVPSRN